MLHSEVAEEEMRQALNCFDILDDGLSNVESGIGPCRWSAFFDVCKVKVFSERVEYCRAMTAVLIHFMEGMMNEDDASICTMDMYDAAHFLRRFLLGPVSAVF